MFETGAEMMTNGNTNLQKWSGTWMAIKVNYFTLLYFNGCHDHGSK
jgi:hypothetical protein